MKLFVLVWMIFALWSCRQPGGHPSDSGGHPSGDSGGRPSGDSGGRPSAESGKRPSGGHPSGTQVRFVLQSAAGKKFRLEKVPYNEGAATVVDSGISRDNIDSFDLAIGGPPDQLYRVRIEGRGIVVPFINETGNIRITCDYASGRYRFNNSPANAELQNFLKEQEELAAKLSNNGRGLNQRIINFADTVSNPGVFMYIYNSIDYGKDFAALKKFILKASARFPSNEDVRQLEHNTLDYIKIFEEEYGVGDSLPQVILPDQYGRPQSTYATGNVYTLLDFWSTWSPGAHKFSDIKKQLRLRVGKDKLAMVSVAIDAEKDNWKKIVDYEHYDWLQLIDEKMWQGPAVKTLKFDSIPFNFLLDPHKRIIAKAIPADSLVAVVSRLVSR